MDQVIWTWGLIQRFKDWFEPVLNQMACYTSHASDPGAPMDLPLITGWPQGLSVIHPCPSLLTGYEGCLSCGPLLATNWLREKSIMQPHPHGTSWWGARPYDTEPSQPISDEGWRQQPSSCAGSSLPPQRAVQPGCSSHKYYLLHRGSQHFIFENFYRFVCLVFFGGVPGSPPKVQTPCFFMEPELSCRACPKIMVSMKSHKIMISVGPYSYVTHFRSLNHLVTLFWKPPSFAMQYHFKK